ncbi:hypothetical protein N1030_15495 [Desulfovibrio mangrovi]|uniref:hypothetical protein n=1 Tax=Desulfovibrio mangrovi TaxID=2976983 RepID=UPI002247B3B9|nr:hypothetical protein [Desulfovibrio mangrovi]UZP66994.1 hypothetical protein N1030_15495 [Desulfovibrio mangrovi]
MQHLLRAEFESRYISFRELEQGVNALRMAVFAIWWCGFLALWFLLVQGSWEPEQKTIVTGAVALGAMLATLGYAYAERRLLRLLSLRLSRKCVPKSLAWVLVLLLLMVSSVANDIVTGDATVAPNMEMLLGRYLALGILAGMLVPMAHIFFYRRPFGRMLPTAAGYPSLMRRGWCAKFSFTFAGLLILLIVAPHRGLSARGVALLLGLPVLDLLQYGNAIGGVRFGKIHTVGQPACVILNIWLLAAVLGLVVNRAMGFHGDLALGVCGAFAVGAYGMTALFRHKARRWIRVYTLSRIRSGWIPSSTVNRRLVQVILIACAGIVEVFAVVLSDRWGDWYCYWIFALFGLEELFVIYNTYRRLLKERGGKPFMYKEPVFEITDDILKR